MRRFLSFTLYISLMIPSLMACGSNEPNTGEEPGKNNGKGEEPDPDENGNTPAKGKALVVYFSCTNKTKGIAGQIADITGADMWQIQPESPYTTADLNYNNSDSRANREQNNPSARPAIKEKLENINEYDIIFLGYPIWWGKAPKIIFTFLESTDLSGKIVIPFCTSNSSGKGSSDTDLHTLASKAEWKTGIRFAANASREEVSSWIESLKLYIKGNSSSFPLANAENGKAPVIKLNSGYDMPILGLGTYSLLKEVCVNSILSAIKNGYRKFDTAYMYNNEESVGGAIRKSGVPREELFVCTKLYPNQFANADNAIEEALKKLNIGYIDLMLLHHPGSNDVKAYKAMEKAVADGKIRSIGLSNYYIKEMEAFLPQVSITPALVQNEIHPYYQDRDVVRYMQDKGIAIEAWYPLGGRGYTAKMFADETISRIAKTHGKSSAQVILRWDLQNGVVVIPGSSNPAHQKENISIFDFELSDDEMKQIDALERREKHDWY